MSHTQTMHKVGSLGKQIMYILDFFITLRISGINVFFSFFFKFKLKLFIRQLVAVAFPHTAMLLTGKIAYPNPPKSLKQTHA